MYIHSIYTKTLQLQHEAVDSALAVIARSHVNNKKITKIDRSTVFNSNICNE